MEEWSTRWNAASVFFLAATCHALDRHLAYGLPSPEHVLRGVAAVLTVVACKASCTTQHEHTGTMPSPGTHATTYCKKGPVEMPASEPPLLCELSAHSHSLRHVPATELRSPSDRKKPCQLSSDISLCVQRLRHPSSTTLRRFSSLACNSFIGPGSAYQKEIPDIPTDLATPSASLCPRLEIRAVVPTTRCGCTKRLKSSCSGAGTGRQLTSVVYLCKIKE